MYDIWLKDAAIHDCITRHTGASIYAFIIGYIDAPADVYNTGHIDSPFLGYINANDTG
jgi:hypothetical protein